MHTLFLHRYRRKIVGTSTCRCRNMMSQLLFKQLTFLARRACLSINIAIANCFLCIYGSAGLPLHALRRILGLLFVLEPLGSQEKYHYAHVVAAKRITLREHKNRTAFTNPYFCKNDSCTSRCAARAKIVFPLADSSCSCSTLLHAVELQELLTKKGGT